MTVTIVLGSAAALLLVPASIFFVQCLIAAIVGERRRAALEGRRPNVAILVPAHDEEAIIEATVRGLRGHLTAEDKLVVVADNCTDATARLASDAGAIVFERWEPDRRGKGYALAFGVNALAAAPPDVVIVVDADCTLAPGSVARLGLEAFQRGRPAQAANIVIPPPEAGPIASLSAFAFLVRNVVRTTGMAALGAPAPLLGTGMAFPWALIASAPLASGALAEDLQLGADLALAGDAPVFCPEAVVTSPTPGHARASDEQRRRWEYGHMGTLLSRGPRLLWQGLRSGRFSSIAMALDLCVPPLSLLVILLLAVLGLSAAAGVYGGSFVPAFIAAGALSLLLAAIAGAWARFGRSRLPLWTLLAAPFYALRKLPMYLGFLRRKPRSWVRTERGTSAPKGNAERAAGTSDVVEGPR